MNKDKTSIHFSTNTSEDSKEIIPSIAGVRSSSSYEKYLGLQVIIRRSRAQAFRSILDRVRSKISNWKTKFLSQTGKEILLKSVVQALPTYCMGVFKPPKVVLKEINKIMCHYWWGQQQNENRIHWISWSQIVTPQSWRSGELTHII